jgi:DNA-binding response OmpR family regulator
MLQAKDRSPMKLSDLAWWQRTIAYEVYPKSSFDTRGQGSGTIAGITAKLDHLASLGVGALWLTPCYRRPMVDNGYDVQDYYAIDPSFGTMGDMDELIARGRDHGIRVVMDLVFNHTSDRCAWFEASCKSRDNEYADWYVWRDAKPDGSAPTNWRSIFGGSAWEWCDERQQYYLHTFARQQPDLNWENPEVRRALFDIANYWANKGVGGFRIDAITYIKKPAVFADGPADGEDGLLQAQHGPFDAAIVDIMLPKMDGLELIRRLRASGSKLPVVVLSARSSVDSRIAGLEAGGDDYVSKPFSIAEVIVRVQTVLRRASADPETVLRAGDLEMDLVTHKVTRAGEAIRLQPLEYQLLEYLLRNKGRVISKTTILERVWDCSFDPHTNLVETRVCRLRDKIDKGHDVKHIRTVVGFGYVLE